MNIFETLTQTVTGFISAIIMLVMGLAGIFLPLGCVSAGRIDIGPPTVPTVVAVDWDVEVGVEIPALGITNETSE